MIRIPTLSIRLPGNKGSPPEALPLSTFCLKFHAPEAKNKMLILQHLA